MLRYMSIKNDLEVLKRELKANHDKNIAVVDRLLARIPESRAPVSLVPALQLKHRDKVKLVEQIIRSTQDNFCIFDIRQKLEKEIEARGGYLSPGGTTANRNIVAQVINKLRHRQPPEIEVVQMGRGSRSGTYAARRL